MKLLLTGAFKYTNEQIIVFENLGFKTIYIQDEREPLDIDVSDIDAVVCNSLFLYSDIRRFNKLKLIQLTSAGLDRIPLSYINKRGIQVFNACGVYSIPMAEWVVLKILEIYKNSKRFYKNQELHKWEKQRVLFELTGKVATIIGYGNVGSEIAKRLKGFGVNIIGVDTKKIDSEYIKDSILINDIDEVLAKSDIIILTLPLTEKTVKFISKEKIDCMKDQAVLINVSRGDIMDETALIKALEREKFLGVALDVFEKEPLGESPLWDFENVIITPHNAFVSDKVNERLFACIKNNLCDFFSKRG